MLAPIRASPVTIPWYLYILLPSIICEVSISILKSSHFTMFHRIHIMLVEVMTPLFWMKKKINVKGYRE
jgi:hypothetical protein